METETQTHTDERQPCKDTGRNWSNVAARKGMPRITGNHQKLGGSKKVFFPRDFRMIMALLTPGFWTFNLYKFEKIKFCCFNIPGSRQFVMAALENKYNIAIIV